MRTTVDRDRIRREQERRDEDAREANRETIRQAREAVDAMEPDQILQHFVDLSRLRGRPYCVPGTRPAIQGAMFNAHTEKWFNVRGVEIKVESYELPKRNARDRVRYGYKATCSTVVKGMEIEAEGAPYVGVATNLAEAIKQALEMAGEDNAEEKPKRKRGRPRKSE